MLYSRCSLNMSRRNEWTNTWKLILPPLQPLATRKLTHLYRLELSFLLKDSADGDLCLTPSSSGEKVGSSTSDHSAHIWTKTPIDTFPIILPTHKGFRFAGVAAAIFRACYCSWLRPLGSAKASASDQQPFRELPSDGSVALTRRLPGHRAPHDPDTAQASASALVGFLTAHANSLLFSHSSWREILNIGFLL